MAFISPAQRRGPRARGFVGDLQSRPTALSAELESPTMSDDAILFDVTDGLAHLTLNRPARLNAVDPDAIALWQRHAHEIAERDDIGAVLFDAVGRAFCAGGDVLSMSRLAGSEPDAGRVDPVARRPDPRRAPHAPREREADRRGRAGTGGRRRARVHARRRRRRRLRARHVREPICGCRADARLRREHPASRGRGHPAGARAHAHLAHALGRRGARLGARRRGRRTRGPRVARPCDRRIMARRGDGRFRAGEATRALGARAPVPGGARRRGPHDRRGVRDTRRPGASRRVRVGLGGQAPPAPDPPTPDSPSELPARSATLSATSHAESSLQRGEL